MTIIKTKKAAEILGGISPAMVREYVKLRWLHAWTVSGETGPGKGYRFDLEEVEAFARGGKMAAAAYRAQRDGNGKPKRGRKVAAQ